MSKHERTKPDEDISRERLHQSFVKYWTKYSEKFKHYWRSLTDKERLEAIKTVCPTMKDTIDKNHLEFTDLLMPEMFCDVLTRNSGQLTIKLCEQFANISYQELMMREYNHAGELYNEKKIFDGRGYRWPHGEHEFKFTMGDKKVFVVKKPEIFYADENSHKMMSEGVIRNRRVAWIAEKRIESIVPTLSLLLDEYIGKVEKGSKETIHTAKAINGCRFCGGEAAKRCSGCQWVYYCSAECQKKGKVSYYVLTG
jgi:hypothetical protein